MIPLRQFLSPSVSRRPPMFFLFSPAVPGAGIIKVPRSAFPARREERGIGGRGVLDGDEQRRRGIIRVPGSSAKKPEMQRQDAI
jgi:hypothetical protein